MIFLEITSKTRNYRLPLFYQYTVGCLFNSIFFFCLSWSSAIVLSVYSLRIYIYFVASYKYIMTSFIFLSTKHAYTIIFIIILNSNWSIIKFSEYRLICLSRRLQYSIYGNLRAADVLADLVLWVLNSLTLTPASCSISLIQLLKVDIAGWL